MRAKAQESGLDPDGVEEVLSSFTDSNGNVDWEGALARAKELGLDADKLTAMVT